MRNFLAAVLLLVTAGQVSLAQRTGNLSICDYYALERYGDNNLTTQYTLMQSIVSLAYAGGSGISGAPNTSTGIFNHGTFNGANVYLRPWFDGSNTTTNLNDQAVGVNWLDGGVLDPLTAFLNGSTTSVHLTNTTNQFRLFSHWFIAFGHVYGCSLASKFPTTGDTGSPVNIAYVHKFMNLNQTDLGYFIDQLRIASKVYGFSDDDAETLDTFMNARYNVRCAPAVNGQLYSLCQATECPLAEPSPDCNAYVNLGPGGASNTTTATQTVTGSAAPTSTPTSSAAPSTSASAPATSTDSGGGGSSLSSGAIAGIAIGGAAVLLIAVGMFLYFRRKNVKPHIVAVPMAGAEGYHSPAYPSLPGHSPNPHTSFATSGPHDSYMGGYDPNTGGYWAPKPEEMAGVEIDPGRNIPSSGHSPQIAEMESPHFAPQGWIPPISHEPPHSPQPTN